jgi:hypothetical protein
MNGVVAVARATTRDGDDATVAMADEDLEVAGPSIGLGVRGVAVVARWHERAVDDPRAAPITERAGREKRRDARHEVCHDPVHLRDRHPEHGGELADGQVRAQARACDDHASRQGAAHGRPRRRCVERNASITARTTRGGRPVSDDVNDVNDVNDMIRSVSLSQL